jgi:hypothetical protein
MKKDDLVKIIRAIVQQELKRELPKALANVFSNLMGTPPSEVRNMKTATPIYKGQSLPHKPSAEEMPDEIDETIQLKQQLREMFTDGEPVRRTAPLQTVQPPKVYTKNPIFNEILNQTRPFNGQERMAMGVGGSGMSPSVMMAAEGFQSSTAAMTGVGELMDGNELGFLNKVPTMPGAGGPVLTELPMNVNTIREGQVGGAAPLDGVFVDSALDLKNHPALPDSIKGILNRDYRSLVKAMNKKK